MNKINECDKCELCTQLDDKDYANALLTALKELSKNYCVALTEASNEKLYEKYLDAFIQIIDMQRCTFELMLKNGWYTLENVESKKMDQKLKTICDEYNKLFKDNNSQSN